MFGFSIVLLLTCGFIVIQAAPRGNVNANKNTNILSRRNYNSNSNNNILGRGPRRSPYIEEATDFDPQLALEEIRDKLYAEGDTEGALIVTAAADAVLAITKTLAEELSGTTALAVADAVAEILQNRLSRGSRNYRRNANYNTNTNTNIVRRDNVKPENELPLDYPFFEPATLRTPVYALRSLESGEINDGGPQSIADDLAALGLTRKVNDALNDEDSSDLVQTLLEEFGETGGNEDQMGQLPASRGMSSNHNSNSNINSNQLNYRRNYNSNANKNSFRRNNVNSNVNNNKIHSRRYRRD